MMRWLKLWKQMFERFFRGTVPFKGNWPTLNFYIKKNILTLEEW